MISRSAGAPAGASTAAGAGGGGAYARRWRGMLNHANPADAAASVRNGTMGSPGAIRNSVRIPDAVHNAWGLRVSWWPIDGAIAVPPEPYVTRIPAAVLTISAGIWVTRPSPIVSALNVCS